MENKNFFESIYNDFFGIEKIAAENEKLRKELNISEDYPAIEVKKTEENENTNTALSSEELKAAKDNKMVEWFEKIEKMYITDDSKNTIKKIIEYIRRYQEKLESVYIPFNMVIYSDDKECINSIIDILNEVVLYFQYIKRGDAVEASFYNIEKAEDIDNIYNSENSIIILRDFEGFNSKEQEIKNKILHRIEEKLEEEKSYLTIIISANKEAVEQAFNMNSDIKRKFFNFEINATKPDVQDVYQEVEEILREKNELSKEVTIKLLDYISATYPKTSLSFPEYRDKLCREILFSKNGKIAEKDIPEYEKEKSMDEVFAELNELVGLTKVKQVLQDLVSLIELKNKTKDELKIKNTNLHMVFLGNPGTGKTTVARIISQILYNLKYIKQNKLIEVSSKDLVAEYVGQTAPKTMAVIEKAMGGVLFIDEAYSLASSGGQGNSYNEEAIATLIQAMENYRDEIVVIFAGYTKEMQAFLDSNSGIVSRIGYTLEFEDYTEDELIQIFESMVKKAGFSLTTAAKEKALNIIREYKDSKNFGNARFARNLYEKTIIKHASNTKGKTSKKALKTISEDDINTENLLK